MVDRDHPRATYIKEEPNYGYEVRFRCGTVQKISR